MADTADAVAANAAKPVKPDENAFKEELDKLEKQHKDVMARYVSLLKECILTFTVMTDTVEECCQVQDRPHPG